MRPFLFTAAFFIICTSFLTDIEINSKALNNFRWNTVDITVQRLSGARVLIAWHTQGEGDQVRYEVMRKHGRNTQFISLGIVQPRSKEDGFADYAFIDSNDYVDSSYYCLKKTTVDDVVFYSLTKSVEGVEKER
jgi:hypothetical protein